MRAWTTGAILAICVSTAFSASSEDRKGWWGLDVGGYFPSSGEIRDIFGDVLLRVGARPFEKRISEKWKFIVDVNALSARKHGSKLFVMPITLGFTRSFGSPDARSIPFVQVAAGPAYYDYTIHRETEVSEMGGKGSSTERISKKRFGANANIEAGILFDHRFAIVARGDFYSKADDFDFSGVSLTVSYAAFRW